MATAENILKKPQEKLETHGSLDQALRQVMREPTAEKSEITKARDTAMKWFENAKDKTTQATKRAINTVDASAKEHPWAYVGAAALVGALLGYVVNQRLTPRAHSRKE